MPIRDCPFTLCSNGIYRPILPVRIINAHDPGKNFRTWGIVDTGADECAIPAHYARLLGHDLPAGIQKTVSTGNGATYAYSHKTRFEIYHPVTYDLMYAVGDTCIDFMMNLPVVLLGANNFLNRFVLMIDYPRRIFSITKPE